MNSISKSLKASSILIAISVGVPSAALATEDEPHVPSVTYTLSVPGVPGGEGGDAGAGEGGDAGEGEGEGEGGGEGERACFAQVGLQAIGPDSGMRDPATGIWFRDLDAEWDSSFALRDRSMDITSGPGFLDRTIPAGIETSLKQRLTMLQPAWSNFLLTPSSVVDGLPIFVSVNSDGDFPYRLNADWILDNRKVAKELDWDQDGIISRNEESLRDFNFEAFSSLPVAIFYDASTCPDDTLGALAISRGDVMMVNAAGAGAALSAEVEKHSSAEVFDVAGLFLTGIKEGSREAGQRSAVSFAEIGIMDRIGAQHLIRPNLQMLVSIDLEDAFPFLPEILIANRFQEFNYFVDYYFWLSTGSKEVFEARFPAWFVE